MPFLFQTVIVHKDSLLGLFKYVDAIKIACTCRTMRVIFKKGKVMKKIVRYGNLGSELRPKYWKRITDQEGLMNEVKDLAGLTSVAN